MTLQEYQDELATSIDESLLSSLFKPELSLDWFNSYLKYYKKVDPHKYPKFVDEVSCTDDEKQKLIDGRKEFLLAIKKIQVPNNYYDLSEEEKFKVNLDLGNKIISSTDGIFFDKNENPLKNEFQWYIDNYPKWHNNKGFWKYKNE